MALVVSQQWLLARYRERQDPRAREALVRQMAPLMHSVARRYYGIGDEEDLRQAAAVGLVKAIDRFDVSRGVAFSTYAMTLMLGEVRRHIRDHTWPVHVARSLQERTLAVGRCRSRLTVTDGRPPDSARIAAELSLTVVEVEDALLAGRSRFPGSLHEPAANSDDGSVTVIDTIPSTDRPIERAEQFADLRRLRHLLDDRDREIAYLTFVEDLTQREVGERVGCTQMQISRHLRRLVDRLSEEAAA
jgi:RNA polymerase sigma-B factor